MLVAGVTPGIAATIGFIANHRQLVPQPDFLRELRRRPGERAVPALCSTGHRRLQHLADKSEFDRARKPHGRLRRGAALRTAQHTCPMLQDDYECDVYRKLGRLQPMGAVWNQAPRVPLWLLPSGGRRQPRELGKVCVPMPRVGQVTRPTIPRPFRSLVARLPKTTKDLASRRDPSSSLWSQGGSNP